MDQREAEEFFRQVLASEIIVAQLQGGKRDGEFVPLWISEAAIEGLKDSIALPALLKIPLDDDGALEVMRSNIERLKQRASAPWPQDLKLR